MSFVLMSPSIEIILRLCSMTSERASCRSNASISASVVMKQSTVAISGRIIPEPFAMMPSRTSTPPSTTVAVPAFE